MSASSEVTKQEPGTVARPLRVLIPLIQDDLQHGRDAAERAGMPYYRAAGEKFIEAKSQLDQGAFLPWVKRHFKIGKSQAWLYMALAREKSRTTNFSSLTDFARQTGLRPSDWDPNASRKPDWQEPVKKIIKRVDTETLNLAREELKRAEEREAQRTLALQLIDIGYRVLARKLHPDKGGSREAMARLNAVRDRLKAHA